MKLVIPQPFGGLVIPRSRGVAIPPVLTFITSAGSAANSTSYTFSNTPIGTPSADRLVIVGLVGQNNAAVAGAAPTGLTIGGVSASFHGSVQGTGTNESSASLWSRLVTSGTTATINATWSDGQVRAGIVVYTLTGYQSASPVSTPSNTTSNSNSISLNFNVSDAQVGVFILSRKGAGSETTTFTNASEDADFNMEAGGNGGGMASASIASGFVGTVTALNSGNTNNAAIGGVWG